ncbi:MAG: SulP family inorganic anion transporter [Geminocystis sp.]|nr:SulP family inorganic anion transporter [Geminocystis sp.]HIK37621.1 SulP family inorganic anion transporter [Geminocystis sp. M7585_C2015_104]MCS7146575.1 SulP family inorganic anion transporter [Geminocystis sp.]MCX8077526.1 SulP family inorganic anion transporter [Geminocystis sp.]MDW8115401.1 SulP family inorganic anion transporter [Geminocystis sp.]
MGITNEINLRNVRGDILGGLTAAVVSLPMALAFGIASGAGALAGLWGAVLVGFFAALFGGTPTLISEPTGPMTVVMTAIIADFAKYDNGMAMAFTVVMMAGLFQILFGFLKLGKYITMMPYTVVSGFMSGIGIILIILQIGPFLGQKTPPGGVVGTLQNLPNLIANAKPLETILAVLTVVILYSVPSRYKRIIPPPLLALIVGTIVSLVFFGDAEIRRIGEIPTGLPKIQFPTFEPSLLGNMVFKALVLGMLGCIDALLTSVVADSLTRTEHDSNKELVGQGLGNFFSGLFGGIAGAGATMGTVVNIQTGAKTALSGIARSVVLFIIVVWAAPLTSQIPLAVLAGIALKVGISIMDWDFLKRVHKISWKATAIVYIVIALTVFIDLMVAVGVGVFIANILTIEKLSALASKSVKIVSTADDEIVLSSEEQQILDLGGGKILLFHLSGPMIFGLAKAISREHNAIENYDVLVVDLTQVPIMGVTSSLALENAIQEAVEKGREVFIVGATGQVRGRLEKLGISRLIPEYHWMTDRLTALQEALRIVREKETIEQSQALV